MTALGLRKDTPPEDWGQVSPGDRAPNDPEVRVLLNLVVEMTDTLDELLRFLRDDLPKRKEIRRSRREIERQGKQRQIRRAQKARLENRRTGRHYARLLRKRDVHGVERSVAIADMASELGMPAERLNILIRLHNKDVKARRKRMRLGIVARMDEVGEPTREIANRLKVSEVQVRRLRKEVRGRRRGGLT